jgi:hypothetical protein
MRGKKRAVWNEDQCWNVVDEINWANNQEYDKKSVIFQKCYPLHGDYMQGFSEHMRKKLTDAAIIYRRKTDEFIPTGGDSGWDLTSHIVGLGKRTFYDAVNNPEVMRILFDKGAYAENFEYVFKTRNDESQFQIQFKPEYLATTYDGSPS